MRVTVPSQIGIAGCDSGARGSSPLECGALAPLSWLRLAAATGSKLPAKSGGEPPHSKGLYVRLAPDIHGDIVQQEPRRRTLTLDAGEGDAD